MYIQTLFARRAKQIIEGHAEQKDPFLLVLASQNIHGPLQAPERAHDPYKEMPDGIRKTALRKNLLVFKINFGVNYLKHGTILQI